MEAVKGGGGRTASCLENRKTVVTREPLPSSNKYMSGQESARDWQACSLFIILGVLPFNFEIQWEICLNYS